MPPLPQQLVDKEQQLLIDDVRIDVSMRGDYVRTNGEDCLQGDELAGIELIQLDLVIFTQSST